MKYFFFDIDGTLAVGSTGIIPENTKKAIRLLQENGHFVAIATGRLYINAINYCKDLGINNLVSDGGSGVTINGKLIGVEPLDYNLCINLLEELDKKGIAWSLTCNNKCIRYCNREQFMNEVEDGYTKTELRKSLDFHKIKNIRKIYISCTKEMEKDIKSLKYLSSTRFREDCLFIENDDKSIGIKKVMDYFNAPYKEVVVFGDESNDLKMFLDEWTSIAMGNATKELKEKADFITKNCDDNGIEYALKHFGWI